MDNVDKKFLQNQLVDCIKKHDSDFNLTEQVFSQFGEKKLLVACSGGPDSMALATICQAFGLDFGLAYVDHGFNAATLECEVLVKSLSSRFEVPFFSTHLNLVSDLEVDSNIEATARKYRYEALEQLRVEHGYEIVLTAHHMDDIAETFLINLVRGAGSGISSLAEKRNNLVRPILHWRKRELLDLVQAVGFDSFLDEMNFDSRFVRNRMRHEVIPLLDEIAGRDVAPLIARTSNNLAKDSAYLFAFARSLWPKQEASTRNLLELDPVLQVHALRAWLEGNPPSSDELERILKVVRHEATSTQISGHRTIWRTGAVLYQDVTPQLKHKP